MAKPIYYLDLILNMNTRLLINALEGVTDEQASERISGHNNPLTWLITHTIWARYNMCKLLGKPAEKNPYEGLFDSFKPFDTSYEFQKLSELRAEWNKASDLLKDALASVTDEHLSGDAPFKNPIGDFTIGGTIAFLVPA